MIRILLTDKHRKKSIIKGQPAISTQWELKHRCSLSLRHKGENQIPHYVIDFEENIIAIGCHRPIGKWSFKQRIQFALLKVEQVGSYSFSTNFIAPATTDSNTVSALSERLTWENGWILFPIASALSECTNLKNVRPASKHIYKIRKESI